VNLNGSSVDQLRKLYISKKTEIIARLREFEMLWEKGDDEEIFAELSFCILTPQSRAKSCWQAIEALEEQDVLMKGSAVQIKKRLRCVRFYNKKAEYIVKARKLFLSNGRVSIKPLLSGFADVYECREWLVSNITGMGYKEASHFLRNVGFGEKIAILDRHILKNLNLLGVIQKIPESLSRAKYILIEKNMAEFAKISNIPLSHLDLLLWYKETGEIFK
jgi:N-glycosylase/DNA lyase